MPKKKKQPRKPQHKISVPNFFTNITKNKELQKRVVDLAYSLSKTKTESKGFAAFTQGMQVGLELFFYALETYEVEYLIFKESEGILTVSFEDDDGQSWALVFVARHFKNLEEELEKQDLLIEFSV